jgi:hypothetical protein
MLECRFLCTSHTLTLLHPLGKCCEEVSRSLEEIFYRHGKPKKEVISEINIAEVSLSANNLHHGDMQNQAVEGASQDDKDDKSQGPGSAREIPDRDRRRRRSSLGSLAQFVRRCSADTGPPIIGHEILANEAAARFQFRSLVLKDNHGANKINRKNSM